MAFEEAVVNIVNHSHATEIELNVHSSKNKELCITLTDDGVPFDPTSSESDTSKAIDELQIGGLGLRLLKQMMDELHYQRTNERNQLTMIKYL